MRTTIIRVERHPAQAAVVVNTSTETCEKCGEAYMIGQSPFCPHAGGSGLVSTQYPFTTKAFNGKEIEVTSAAHERALCQEYGVVKRDDAAWIEKEYLGFNPKTKKQEYKEGRGVGLPGCWV